MSKLGANSIDLNDVWVVLNDVFAGVSNTLTHHQYLELFKPNNGRIPEVRLWLGVLETVYIDWLEHKTDPTNATAQNVAEIKSWIYTDGPVMSLIGDTILLIFGIPYDKFKKKLYTWLSNNEPLPVSVSIDIGTLFDEVPKPEIDLGGSFIEYLIQNN